MKPLCAIATAVVLFGALRSTGAEPNKDEYAAKIVGTWELVKAAEGGAPIGSLVTFTKDGKLTLKTTLDGKEVTLEGTYKVEKDQLVSELKMDGNTLKETDLIKKLTDDELQLQDEESKINTLKRKK